MKQERSVCVHELHAQCHHLSFVSSEYENCNKNKIELSGILEIT